MYASSLQTLFEKTQLTPRPFASLVKDERILYQSIVCKKVKMIHCTLTKMVCDVFELPESNHHFLLLKSRNGATVDLDLYQVCLFLLQSLHFRNLRRPTITMSIL